MPTINPVCYNGLTKPTRDAVNFGPVSLGTVSQDYTTLTSNDWRAGINPSTNTVIYTDTYSRGVDSQAAAVPSIHWISGQSQANIIELISRLPERAADNYEIFASYADAINWLINTQGTYMLVNTKYPEYLLDAECAVNLELGFLASYPGIDQYVYDLVSGGSQNIFSANVCLGDYCYNKICQACDNISHCVKCDKTLCYDCCETFWCYECENGFCYDCEERIGAIDGVYCKPCAIKLNID